MKDNSKEVLTEITSNYFPVLMTTKYLSPGYKVKYITGETDRSIIYNDNKSSLTFSKDGKEQAVFYDDKTTADADASTTYTDIPAGLKGVFNTTFELTGANKQYFAIDATTGKVTLAETAFGQVGLVGQTVDVEKKIGEDLVQCGFAEEVRDTKTTRRDTKSKTVQSKTEEEENADD